MSNVAKLKKRALEYEQKKQFDKALDTYMQILAELDDHIDEADVALYNRVGDLLLRRGDVSEAVDHYEKAVDLYTDGGFFNNAIALCNKILRNAPGRSTVYYKLGKISARKGFINDAKQNFLEYADRMQKAGQLEEAFRALKEFADLCPDQDDIRLMLADQLVRKNRKGEAIEQLQALFDKFSSEGREREARATVDRMKAIDPALEPPPPTGNRPTPKSGDLIFLDVTYDEPPAKATPRRGKSPTPSPGGRRGRGGAPLPDFIKDLDLPLIEVPPDEDEEAEALPGLSHGATLGGGEPDASEDLVSHIDAALITGFEQTNLAEPEGVTLDAGAAAGSLDGADSLAPLAIEPTSIGDGVAAGHTPPRVSALSDASMLDELPSLDELPGLDELPALDELPIIDTGGVSPHDLAGLGPELGDADLPSIDMSLDDEPQVAAHGAPSGGLTLIFPEDTASEDASSNDGEEPPETTDDLPLLEPLPPLDATDFGPLPPLEGLSSLEGLETLSPTPTEEPVAPLPGLAQYALPDETLPLDDEIETAAPSAATAAHAVPLPPPIAPEPIARRVDRLRAEADAAPSDWQVRRQLGEALLEDGERADGIAELDVVMLGFEHDGDLSAATRVADELARIEPGQVRYHQKRVEYAVRAGDKARLVDAYLDLAECLFRAGQIDKSRAVYTRVSELAPEDSRARSALRSLGGDPIPELEPSDPTPTVEAIASSGNGAHDDWPTLAETLSEQLAPEVETVAPDVSVTADAGAGTRDSFVNLSDWLAEDESPKTTRMVAEVESERTEQEVDFAEMLTKFKQGVAANVEEADHESHYDLGVAYKEMGLLDEAIAEFQKALRGTEQRVRTAEALGQCFVEKRQFQVAQTVLLRALTEGGHADDTLVGVLYLLGYASEALGQWADALKYYERVFAVDIRFRDVSDRLAAVERNAK